MKMLSSLFLISAVVSSCICSLVITSGGDAEIASAGSQPVDLYVALNGSDSNSGLSPAAALASLNGAAARIVMLRSAAHVCHGDVTVHIAAGVYFTTTAQVLHPDALLGNSTCPSRVVFEGPGAVNSSSSSVISAGMPLMFNPPTRKMTPEGSLFYESAALVPKGPQGLTQQNIWNLWQAQSSNSSDEPFHRIPACRSPMSHYDYFSGENSSPPNTMYLQFSSATFPRINVSHISDYYVRMYHSWTSTYSKIYQIDVAKEQIVLAGHLNDCSYNTASGNRYEIINIPPVDGMPLSWQKATLITPGSKCFTSSVTPDGKFFEVRVFSRSNFSVVEPFVAPSRANILTVSNSNSNNPAAPVAPLTFHKLTFAHSDSRIDEDCPDGCSQSGADLTRAAVEVMATSNIKFLHANVVNTGGYGLWLHSGTLSAAVEHCEFSDLGAGGIRIGANAGGLSPNEDTEAHDINVTDCRIHNGGQVEQAGCGVFLQRAHHVNIVHNDIFDMYYTGVSTGWTWGWAPTSNSFINVSFNHIYEIGKATLSDMGCIYNLGISPGTVFTNNVCHDVVSFGYGGWGYYADEGTSETLWQNNIAYRTKGGGFHQHYGLNNMVLNNVLAFPISTEENNNGDRSCLRSSAPDSGYYITSFSVVRNILLMDNVNSSLYFSTNYASFNNVTFANNTYWSNVTAAADLLFPPTQSPVSWSSWISGNKRDVHSVIADPLFVDAGHYDFSNMSPSSPAILHCGFQPIDTKHVGPRKS